MISGTSILLLFLVTCSSCYVMSLKEVLDNAEYMLSPGHCGPGFGSGWISLALMDTCSPAKPHFNHCCAMHDDCYDRQENKESCDDKFFYCNEHAIKKHAGFWDICFPWLHGSSAAVRSGGIVAYEISKFKKYNGPYFIPALTEKGITQQRFSEFYKECAYHKIVVASCAYNLQQCVLKHERLCGTQARDCIPEKQNGQDPDKSSKCYEAIKNLKYAVYNR